MDDLDDPVVFNAAVRDENARKNFWNHHSFAYLEDMIT
jgi:hypothetical protein